MGIDLDRQTVTMILLGALLGTGGGSGLSSILDNDDNLKKQLETIIEKSGREEQAQWDAIKERITNKDLEIFLLKRGCQ